MVLPNPWQRGHALVEDQPLEFLGNSRRVRRSDKNQNGLAFSVAIANLDRIGQARSNVGRDRQPVHHHEDRLREINVQQ
jgi:hypothetical protein